MPACSQARISSPFEVAAVGDGFEFIDLQNGLGFPRHVR
jgi:hypothetical protein